VAASAATFAISYLPWVGLGPILAALAERYPYRRTMIICDVARMVLITLVALPRMPTLGMIALLFLTALFNPPFEAARSALLPRILGGDRYVVAITLQATTNQTVQIVGYLSGASLSAIDARVALLFNAATFAASACVIALAVKPREPLLAQGERTALLKETAGGLAVVFRSPILRAVAILVFLTSAVSIVPEGLAAAWAAEFTDDPAARGWIQGGIMMSNPLGFVVGGLIMGRFVRPTRRLRAIPLFAVAVPLSLIPAVIHPPVYGVFAISFVCGAAVAGLNPGANGLFVQVLPGAFRARAFGVMRSGMLLAHGTGVFATGWLAEHYPLPVVVGIWGLVGGVLVIVAALRWPTPSTINAEIARIRELNEAAGMAIGRSAPPDPAPAARKPGAHRRNGNERATNERPTGERAGNDPVALPPCERSPAERPAERPARAGTMER